MQTKYIDPYLFNHAFVHSIIHSLVLLVRVSRPQLFLYLNLNSIGGQDKLCLSKSLITQKIHVDASLKFSIFYIFSVFRLVYLKKLCILDVGIVFLRKHIIKKNMPVNFK